MGQIEHYPRRFCYHLDSTRQKAMKKQMAGARAQRTGRRQGRAARGGMIPHHVAESPGASLCQRGARREGRARRRYGAIGRHGLAGVKAVPGDVAQCPNALLAELHRLGPGELHQQGGFSGSRSVVFALERGSSCFSARG